MHAGMHDTYKCFARLVVWGFRFKVFQQSLKLQEGFRTADILKGLPKESSVCMCYELSRFARPEERTQLEAEKPSETKTLRSELNLTRTLAAEVDQSYETKTL